MGGAAADMTTGSLMSVLWSSRLVVLLFSMLIYSFGFATLVPVLPTLLTNFFASRRAGQQIDCESFLDLEPHSAACQDAHADAVLWNSWTSLVANTFISFIFSPLIGDLSDTYGRKPFIVGGLMLSAMPVMVVFLYLTQEVSLLWYFPCNAVTSIIPIIVVFLSYTADVLQPQHRTAGFGLIIAAFSLGFTMGPQLGGFLQPHTAALVAGAGCLLSTAVVVVAVPESKNPAGPGVNSSSSQVSKQRPIDALLSIRRSWALINSSSLFKRLAVCMAIVGIVSEGVRDMLLQYLQLVVGFNTSDQSMLITVLGATNLVVQAALLPFLAATLGERVLLLFGLCFSVLEQALLAITVSKWQAYAAVALGSLAGVSFPAISSIKSTHTRADQQGLVQGALAGIRALATGLGPLAFAQLFAMCTKTTGVLGYKPGLVFWTAGGLSLVAAAVAASIPSKLIQRPGQQQPGNAAAGSSSEGAVAGAGSTAAAAAAAGDYVAISVEHDVEDSMNDHDRQDAAKSGGRDAGKVSAAKPKTQQQQAYAVVNSDRRSSSNANRVPMLCAAAAAAWQEELQSGLQSAPSFMVRRAIMTPNTGGDQDLQVDHDADDHDDLNDQDPDDHGVEEPLLR